MHAQAILMSAIPASGPFSPPDIAGLTVWLKADGLSLNNNDPVSTWTDSSGNGHDATQSGGSRPVYKTGIKNSKPAVLFAGGQYMSGSLTLSQPMTVFFVIQHLNTGTDYQFYLDGASNRVAFVRLVTGSDGYDLFAGADAVVSQAQDSNWHYLSGVVNGASSIVAINGTATTGLDSGSNSLGSTYYLGCFGPTPGMFYMDGYIAEMIIYNSALNTTNRQLVEAYLAAKYAI